MSDVPRLCEGCGGPINRPGRADQRYHGAGCRMRAMRAREITQTPRGPRRPLRPHIARATNDLRRAVERIERLALDDRFHKAVDHDRALLTNLADRINKATQP